VGIPCYDLPSQERQRQLSEKEILKKRNSVAALDMDGEVSTSPL
jgi:hypothetical protein